MEYTRGPYGYSENYNPYKRSVKANRKKLRLSRNTNHAKPLLSRKDRKRLLKKKAA